MIEVRADGSIVDGAWGTKERRHLLPTIYGGWYATSEDGSHIHHDSRCFGTRKSNSSTLAEYFAIRSSLYWLKTNGMTSEPVRVYSDSQVAVRQLSGAYRCNTVNLKILLDSCKGLAAAFPKVSYHWQPREQMREADVLSKGLQTFGYVPSWQEVLDSVAQL